MIRSYNKMAYVVKLEPKADAVVSRHDIISDGKGDGKAGSGTRFGIEIGIGISKPIRELQQQINDLTARIREQEKLQGILQGIVVTERIKEEEGTATATATATAPNWEERLDQALEERKRQICEGRHETGNGKRQRLDSDSDNNSDSNSDSDNDLEMDLNGYLNSVTPLHLRLPLTVPVGLKLPIHDYNDDHDRDDIVRSLVAISPISIPDSRSQSVTKESSSPNNNEDKDDPRPFESAVRCKPNDILLGCGDPFPDDHHGNTKMKCYVDRYRDEEYAKERKKVIREVVTLLQKNGGRFLRRHADFPASWFSNWWEEVPSSVVEKWVDYAFLCHIRGTISGYRIRWPAPAPCRGTDKPNSTSNNNNSNSNSNRRIR